MKELISDPNNKQYGLYIDTVDNELYLYNTNLGFVRILSNTKETKQEPTKKINIDAAIKKYFDKNPIEVILKDSIQSAVKEYLENQVLVNINKPTE